MEALGTDTLPLGHKTVFPRCCGMFSELLANHQASIPNGLVPIQYIRRPNSKDMGTSSRLRCIPQNYMDPWDLRSDEDLVTWPLGRS